MKRIVQSICQALYVDSPALHARQEPSARAKSRDVERSPLRATINHLLSRRHSSTARRIASPRPHFFLSIPLWIKPSLPSFDVVINTLLNSSSIRGSTFSGLPVFFP